MSRPRLIALLLALVTLLVYLPVVHHDFLTYDDEAYVTANRMVQAGFTAAGICWAFTSFEVANWHPLTWLSHMADCELFGLNAGAHHLVNALFHAANSALLFLLLWRLTQKTSPAFMVAALFAWHPLHVESVAWVAERKDLLSTFFALLTLLAYSRYVVASWAKDSRSRIFYMASLVCFALGLLAKPMLVTLPFGLLLLDFWPLNRYSTANLRSIPLREKIPFFSLTAASCVLTLMAQSSRGAVISLEVLPLHYRLENATVALARYVMKLFWPVNLSVIYPFELSSSAAVAVAFAMIVLVSVIVWRQRICRPYWLVGWLWFVGTMVPVLGIVQVGGAIMADRYTYIPSIGIFMALVFGVKAAWWSKFFPRLAAAVTLGLCLILTEYQLALWRDSETLFRHALAVTENNLMAHYNMAIVFDRQRQYAQALAEYRAAEPMDSHIHYAIGGLLLKIGKPAEALKEFRTCRRQYPDEPVYHNAVAAVLAAQGDLAGAQVEFTEAERMNPHYAQPHIELARIYLSLGEDDRARKELHAAVQAAPNQVETLTNVARILAVNSTAAKSDGADALALALRANALSGNREPEVFDVLGMAFAATGDFTNAVVCAQNALELAPAANLKNTNEFHLRLERYQNRQPWRELLGGTNAANSPAGQ